GYFVFGRNFRLTVGLATFCGRRGGEPRLQKALMNGCEITFRIDHTGPFTLSPSTWLKAGLSKGMWFDRLTTNGEVISSVFLNGIPE
ncbi:MAG: hypothetical protein Q8R95_10830, partial [Azonexus sp.]|nr:hypothetical protein [Azonexus sp.]